MLGAGTVRGTPHPYPAWHGVPCMECLKGAPNIQRADVVAARLRRKRPRQRTCNTSALGSAGSAVTCQGVSGLREKPKSVALCDMCADVCVAEARKRWPAAAMPGDACAYGKSISSLSSGCRRLHQRAIRRRRLSNCCDAQCQGEADRRAALQRYVSLVKPDVIAEFSQHAPPPVVEAMRSTCSNILGALLASARSGAHTGNVACAEVSNRLYPLFGVGALPAQYFQVKVSSTAESLAQLMYSVLLTGYLFRNAFYRMQLRNSLAAGDSHGAGDSRVATLSSALSLSKHHASRTAADACHAVQELFQHHLVRRLPRQQLPS